MRRPRRRGLGHEAEGGWAVLVVVLVVLAMVLGGWVTAYAAADGRLPRGTTIAGVDVGGEDRTGAVRALAAGVVPALTEPITVSIGTTQTQITAAQAGLSVDAAASVAQALGRRSWDPRQLWAHFTGGRDLGPVVHVDSAMMTALVQQLDEQAGQVARDGAVSVAGGVVEITRPRDGAELDEAAAQEAIVAAWSSGRRQVELPLQLAAPDIDETDVATAVSTLANPALSASVTLGFAASQVTLTTAQYAGLLSIVPRDGALALDVDPVGLSALVSPASQDVAPVDATVSLQGGQPVVVPAVDGTGYDDAGATAAFLQAVVAQGDARTVAVTGTATRAGFRTRDARRLRIREQVSSFDVAAPVGDPAFDAAVARLSGAVVRPGETFSLNARAGDAGGSATSLATAVWNAGLLAAMSDVARTAPTAWSGIVPEGRDATVAAAGPDLQLRNDTSHGLLLAASSAGGVVSVSVWSTKEYDVTLAAGARYAPTAPSVRTDTDPACVADPGAEGFSVDLTRTLTPLADPTALRTDVVTTSYLPRESVVCAPAVVLPVTPPAA